MQNSESITIFHMTLLSMTAIGFKNHVLIIPPLLQSAGRDAWISLLIALIFSLLWGLLLIYIHNGMQQQHITQWLTQRIGKFFTIIIIAMICIYITLQAAYTLRDTIIWIKINFLPSTPLPFGGVILGSLCCLAAASGLRTLSIVNFFLLAVVLVLGFFVAIVNLQFKDYSLLLPVLENGFKPVLKASIYPQSGIIELILFILLQQKIMTPFRYRHIVVNILLLVGLTLGPLIGAIAEFGPVEASKQQYPAYEEWGLVQIGQFVEHLDYLSIYQWFSGVFIRTSLLLLVMIELLNIQKKRNRNILWFVTFVVVVILTQLPISDMKLHTLLKDVLLPMTVFFMIGLSLLLTLLVRITRKKGSTQQ
ncbi:spore germination protein (amino acid permease) [Aneurinibacillus soli]|uniref:Spore germination protein n=1 Tax=Aneurinibacillus soli TaxID=1500254 RepID=A0A0U4WN54_9BACL|nr:endospore germination permease [Aneurinibacillus soli]PYE61875.1 spore germination protein (amino acid permease) [Aneurinibacillus soli]BAU29691.1 Spore germination protein [Aneurinibacillus soli]